MSTPGRLTTVSKPALLPAVEQKLTRMNGGARRTKSANGPSMTALQR